jgi:hypothetical protein
MPRCLFLLAILFLFACHQKEQSLNSSQNQPQKIESSGYSLPHDSIAAPLVIPEES